MQEAGDERDSIPTLDDLGEDGSGLAALLADVSPAMEHQARARLTSLPVPLTEEADTALWHRRRMLERVAAEAAHGRGASDELLAWHRRAWMEGGSAVPWVELLLETGQRAEASMWARVLTQASSGREDERAALRSIAHRASLADEPWLDALAEFAADPTPEAWEGLTRFGDGDLGFERTQLAVQWLREAGADADAVYRALAPRGVTSQLAGLVEDGLVDPAVVEQNLHFFVSDTARAMMLMSAALGALKRGDELGVVRLVEHARRFPAPPECIEVSLRRILEVAPDEVRRALTPGEDDGWQGH